MKWTYATAVLLGLWATTAQAQHVEVPGPACHGPECTTCASTAAPCASCQSCASCEPVAWKRFCAWLCYRSCNRDHCVIPVARPPLFAYFECKDGCRDRCPTGHCQGGIARIGQPLPPGNSPPPEVAGEQVSLPTGVPTVIQTHAVGTKAVPMTIVSEPMPSRWKLFGGFQKPKQTMSKMEVIELPASTTTVKAAPVGITTTTSMKVASVSAQLPARITPVPAKSDTKAVPISPYGNYPYLYPSTSPPAKK